MQIIDQLVLDENNIAFHPMMGNSYQLNSPDHQSLIVFYQTDTEFLTLPLIYPMKE